MNQPLEPVVSGMELWQWRYEAISAAIAANIPTSEVDWLLLEIASLDRLALRLESFKDRPQIPLKIPMSELVELWQKRINARMPVQYLTGVAPWRNFSLAVSPAVLIPRPETECLIDLAVAAVKNSWAIGLELGDWADLGTGSGAIALGLAEVFPQAKIHAVDLSVDALAIARKNAEKLGFLNQIQFHQGCWWEPLEILKVKFSGMISNPPYIPANIIPTLQPEVANHEPTLALDGGFDGLDCIRNLIETSPNYLQSGGVWLIEMMGGQAEIVAELLRSHGAYTQISIHADLAGIERFAIAYRR